MEEWSAKLFGCGPFTSQARLTFYQTDVSFVLLLEINATITDVILLVHLTLFK